MTNNHPRPDAETPVAVLHRVGQSIRVVVGGTPEPGRIAAWQTFAADRPQELSAWLDEHHVRSVIGVLPASAVICRTCTLPDADADHLRQALALQAEAHMLTEVPEYRQARAVLPIAEGETSRSGIMVAWPQAPGNGGPPGPDVAGSRRLTFAPDVAGLAALLNGRRPSGPLLWFDPTDGSVALAISNPNGAVFRAARIGTEPDEAAADSVGRVIAETALSVGLTPQFTQTLVDYAASGVAGLDQDGGLVAPPEILTAARERLGGSPDDPHWWRDYGVAAGVLMAAAGNQLAPLTRLIMAAPSTSPSRGQRLVEAMADPASAIRIVAVCAAVVLLGPLLLAGLRVQLLELKKSDAFLKEARNTKVQLAMYRELKDRAWPMTKLLSDIACNTPQSIDIEHIRLRHGEPVIVSGRAKRDQKHNLSAQEVVALMQDNFRNSNVFEEIYLNWGDSNSFGSYEFTVKAKVTNPYHRHAYPEGKDGLDYGDWTLAERLYGKRPEATATLVNDETPPAEAPPEIPQATPLPAETGDPVDETRADGRAAPRNGRTSRSAIRGGGTRARRDVNVGSAGTDRSRAGGSIPASQDIPEPLTREQIDVMTLADAQETYGHLSQALQQARVDENLRKRLWKDWRMVRDRVRDLKAAEKESS